MISVVIKYHFNYSERNLFASKEMKYIDNTNRVTKLIIVKFHLNPTQFF